MRRSSSRKACYLERKRNRGKILKKFNTNKIHEKMEASSLLIRGSIQPSFDFSRSKPTLRIFSPLLPSSLNLVSNCSLFNRVKLCSTQSDSSRARLSLPLGNRSPARHADPSTPLYNTPCVVPVGARASRRATEL